MLSDKPQWVAVYTSSRAEKQVAARLTEAGIENYLPLRRVKHRWSDRIKIVEEPLIKSYTFARITAKQEYSLRGINGVVWIIAFKGKVATIPDEEIEAMRQFVESEKPVAVYETSKLKFGAAVEITDGPFKGRRGEIVSDCKDGNFAIRIDALSFSLVVDVNQNILRALKAEKKPKGLFYKD